MSTTHGDPPEDLCCLCTMEDITKEAGNYVEYQSFPSLLWQPALYERSVIERLLAFQFHDFVRRVHATDCQAELRRLLAQGPPIYLSDPHALPLIEGDTHVCQLWYASDDVEASAVLDGAVQGSERDKLWNELREFIICEGKEEGDEEDTTVQAKT